MRVRSLMACLACLAIASSSSIARAADVEISEESRRHFKAGVLLLEDPKVPRYEEAYREFKEAFAASPSYKILGNLGICAMKLERDDEAIAAFERYLAEMTDLDAAERAQIEKDLVTLRTGVVHVAVTSDPPGAIVIDVRIPVQGDRVTNSYGPLTEPTRLGIHQGHHRMTARLPGRADVDWEVEASGDLGTHVFTFAPPPTEVPPPIVIPIAPQPTLVRPIPARVYVGMGVTVAALAGATITGISALSSHDDYARLNDGNHPAEASDARDTGRRLNLATDLLIGTAVVAASVTTVLYLIRPSVEAPSQPAAAWRIAPMYGTGGTAGLSVGGAFQ
ncbi:MAG: hypothetical protein JWM74_1081 [Myxococcaceae bacterium]|nr:hypothetical protein [Myxococcaceae bacterium]